MAGFFRRMGQRSAEADALPRPVPVAPVVSGPDPIEEHADAAAQRAHVDEQRSDATAEAKPRANPASTARSESISILREVRVELERSVPAHQAPVPGDEGERGKRAASSPAKETPVTAMRAPQARETDLRTPEVRHPQNAREQAMAARVSARPIESPAPIVPQAPQVAPARELAADRRERDPEIARPVQVSIGRIEIRTNPQPAAVTPERTPPAQRRLSLDDYLARPRR